MAKYGRGLRIEFTEEIIEGKITEPVTTEDLKIFCKSKGWNVPDSYTNVYLINASSDAHSPNFVKCFKQLEKGKYVLRENYKRRYSYAI